MLFVRNVSYEIGEKCVLKGVSFTLGDAEKAGLIGANGAGKTTLFRLITGLLTPSSGIISFPSRRLIIGLMPQTVAELEVPENTTVFDFLLSGRPIGEISGQINAVSERLAVIDDPQEQRLALKKLGRLQQEFEDWGGYHAEDELLRILSGLQMEGIDLNIKVGALSGGEKSKANFARVLYSNPGVLLLDEPTNHLDGKSQEWLVGFIKKFAGCVLIISHDALFLDATVSKIIRLDEISRSADVFHGNYTQHIAVLAQRRATLQRMAVNQEQEMRHLRKYLERMHGVSGKRKRQVAGRERKLEQLKRDKVEVVPPTRVVRTKLLSERKSGENPLVVRDVSYGYEGGKKVLSHISLTLTRNERLVVVGVNGAGKSTLLKLIVGSLSLQSGEIIIGPKTDIGYYAQEHEGINLQNTVLEEIGTVSELSARNLRSVLASFLFRGEAVFQSVATLSPGEKSRLALAKLSLSGANLLLLDEPTNHLDSNTSSAIAVALRGYEGPLIVVSHDVVFLDELGIERMLILPRGEVAYYDRNVIKHLSPSVGKHRKGSNGHGSK